MHQPVEVHVDEHEQIVERVAAIDVAKASGMVCVRVPHESVPGRRVSKVWPLRASTAALVKLGDHLRCERVQRVVMESTSVDVGGREDRVGLRGQELSPGWTGTPGSRIEPRAPFKIFQMVEAATVWPSPISSP